MTILAAISSALLLSLALPNELFTFGHPILGLFCLAPYFLALSRERKRSVVVLSGFLFGILSNATSSYWLFFFKDFKIWTIGATSLTYGFIHILVALYLNAFSCEGMAPAQQEFPAPRARWLRPFLIASIWTIWECLKSRDFLGYPWGLVAYTINTVDILVQIVEITGVWGLTFLMSLSNAVIAELAGTCTLVGHKLRCSTAAFPALAVTIALFLLSALFGAAALAFPAPVTQTVPMVLVQHNSDSWESGALLDTIRSCQELSLEGVEELRSRGVDKPELVVWSESVLTRPYRSARDYYRLRPVQYPFFQFLQDLDAPLLVGSPEILSYEQLAATNSVLLLRSDAEIAYSYAKRHPVPFAEAIPFWEYAWMRNFMNDVIGLSSGWVMGSEVVVMELDRPDGSKLRFGTPICFEDAFADVCRDFFDAGADLLINLTNDSWSRTVSAEVQHFVAAKFRCIENRRVMVRSTNGGLTSVINAQGQLIASLPFFVPAQLAVEVPVQAPRVPTLYSRMGDWLPLLLAAGLIAHLLRMWLDSKRSS